ncbi:tyrosine-type recombinase/integrase [Acinetobacter haemolyticus]|uniref:tyrosine-type recombinase/integrase n=1 Tax=Acinetobacter haemolyticus TaxID=29430 RepID=UPI000E58A958|nr:site-specific integrase [Acinetobacter haemolyticus]QDJ91847.1 site-specific integrase [Acinetobacter haemolyticus]
MKIPKPRKRGETYTITVSYQNKRYYCTRDTAKECEQWAALKLLELKSQTRIESGELKPKFIFRDLNTKYYQDVGQLNPSKSSRDWIKGQYKTFEMKFGALAQKSIYDITPKDLTNWRNKRSSEVSANTVLKEISHYSAMFTYAQKELFLLDDNPWMQITKPKKPKARDRRIHPSEIELILKVLDYEMGTIPVLSQHYVAWGFLFAIETAMRKGELVSMQKNDIHDGHVHIPKSKNGDARNVPLSEEAKALLELIKHDGRKVIPQSINAFRLMWEKRKAAIGLNDLHFHDTRHEAITRMVRVRKLPVEILAKITGHKKIDVLVNTYYNPNADDLVEAFNR